MASSPRGSPRAKDGKKDTVGPGDWSLSQTHNPEPEYADAAVISAVEFRDDGHYIALGNTAGELHLLRHDGTSSPDRGSKGSSTPQYSPFFKFRAHDQEFDCLKSLDIEEKINVARWLPKHNGVNVITCNDKTIKYWKVNENSRVPKSFTYKQTPSLPGAGDAKSSMVLPRIPTDGAAAVPVRKPKAVMRRAYRNAHAYHINSLSANSDGETFLSADDLRVYLWHVARSDETFLVLDIKPSNMEELSEVITCAAFDSNSCHMFAYSSSRGDVKLQDLRTSAVCKKPSALLSCAQEDDSYFSEIVASTSHINFSADGRRIFARNYMTVQVWDVANTSRPLSVINVQESMRGRLQELYESDMIFDKFQCASNPDGTEVATGSYGNVCSVYNAGGARQGCFEVGASAKAASTPRSRGFMRGRKDKDGAAKLSGPPANARVDQRVLSMAWHPSERVLALAANSTLYLYSS